MPNHPTCNAEWYVTTLPQVGLLNLDELIPLEYYQWFELVN